MAVIDRNGVVLSQASPPSSSSPSADLAIKTACLVATTGSNIVLSGVQTVDGVQVGNNSERVLVKDQTNQTQNGLYNASTGNWTRTTDAQSNTQVAQGMQVEVSTGAVNALAQFFLTTPNAINLGTSNIVFARQAVVTLGSLTLGATFQQISSTIETIAGTGDVTWAANSFATTLAAIQGTAISGTTGTGAVVLSSSPTIGAPAITGGTITTAAISGGTIANTGISGAAITGGTISGAAISGGSISGIGTLSLTSGLTVTANNGASIVMLDQTSGDQFQLGSVLSNLYYAAPGLTFTAPVANLRYVPVNTSTTEQVMSIRATNARLQISAEETSNVGLNPMIVLSDLNCFGTPVLGGGNQPGVGIFGNGVQGSSAFTVNIANLGGATSGQYNSLNVNLWNTSADGATQSIITFFNGTGTNAWNGSMTATQAGARLGEICGCGSLADGHFTETETWSINGYAEANFGGTSFTDGTYIAPTNIVFRVAPNSSNPEQITAVFDYNNNLLIGNFWSTHGNSASTGTQAGLWVRGVTANPGQINVKFNQSSVQGISIQNDSGTDAGAGHCVLIQNGAGTNVGSITQNGTATAFNTSSDRRMKMNIRPLGEVGDIIDALEVVRHGWIGRSTESIGFIAQDEYAVYPDAVTPGDDDAELGDPDFRAWQRDDSKLVPLLVREMQTIRRRVSCLEALRVLN